MNELLTMLDTKYKRLEYIQSTGTQYINLGLTANQDITIKCRVSNVNSGTQPFMGLTDIENADNIIYGFGQQSANNYLFGQYYQMTGSGYINRILSNIAGNDGVIRNFELRKNEFYIDNVLIGSKIYHTFISTNTIKLFTLNPSSSKASIKIYNAQVLDGNMNLLRNMIPVMRKSDNEIGMLDLVEGKFYGNAGTGKFTANLDTMYAIIQGSPTVQDGRVSGFSVGSCLLSQQEIGNKPFEIVAKINLTTMGYLSPIFVGSDNPALTLHIDSSKLKMQIGNGTSWVSSILVGTTTISTNTDYYVKLVFDGTKFIGYLSPDGTNWNKEFEWVNTISVLPTYYLKIGNDRLSSTYYLRGTIDLNRSYIKIDDTKYKLQAVVGYTVVGNPTITDGVVSGFSSSNYLTIPKPTTINEFELNIKFSFSDLNSYQFLLGDNTNNGIQLQKNNDTSNTIRIRYCNGSSSTNISIFENPTINKDYIINVKVKGTKAFVIFEIVGEEKFTQEYNLDYNVVFGLSNWLLGRRNVNEGSVGFLIGEIDLNNTYIKINNKLWFNGLPNN